MPYDMRPVTIPRAEYDAMQNVIRQALNFRARSMDFEGKHCTHEALNEARNKFSDAIYSLQRVRERAELKEP